MSKASGLLCAPSDVGSLQAQQGQRPCSPSVQWSAFCGNSGFFFGGSLPGDFSEFRKQICVVGIFLKMSFLKPFPKACRVGVYT